MCKTNVGYSYLLADEAIDTLECKSHCEVIVTLIGIMMYNAQVKSSRTLGFLLSYLRK